MHKLRLILLFLILALSLTANSQQANTALGDEFWFTFIGIPCDAYKLRVVVFAPDGCQGVLENPNQNWQHNIGIGLGGIDTIEVPMSVSTWMPPGTSIPIGDYGLHLSTDNPVMAWADYMLPQTSGMGDATLLYPVASLGCEYVATAPIVGDFKVVATEDSTVVEVTSTAAIVLGTVVPNAAQTFVLDRGQVLWYISDYDLSGSRIRSLNNKKLAVFCGATATTIPQNTMFGDICYAQALPNGGTDSTDNTYQLPLLPHERYLCKVTALGQPVQARRADQTQSTQINAWGTWEFMVDTTWSVLQRRIITTGGATQVAIFSLGLNADHRPEGGDPAMAFVYPNLPVRETTLRFRTLGIQTEHNLHHFLVVEGTMQGVTSGMISLDGASLSPYLNYDTPTSEGYFYGKIPLTRGAHTLHVPNNMTVTAYLYGKMSWGAYLSNLRFNNPMPGLDLSVNGQPCTDTARLCPGSDVVVSASTEAAYDSLLWTWNGTAAGTADSIRLTLDDTAVISCRLFYTNHDSVRYIENRVVILPYPTALTLDTMASCMPISYNGDSIAIPGSYQWTLSDQHGCDSVVKLEFILLESKETTLRDSVCPGNDYPWMDDSYSAPGTYTTTLQTYQGCDSTVTLTLSLFPIPIARIELSAKEVTDAEEMVTATDISTHATDRQWWIGDEWRGSDATTEFNIGEGNTSATLTLIAINEHGCADTTRESVRLTGHKMWIPNVITPNQEGNRTFRIITRGVLEMEVVIFNRRGQQIAQFDGLTQGWDGTYEGQPLPQGAYVWKARYRDIDIPEAWQIKTGTVTIVY